MPANGKTSGCCGSCYWWLAEDEDFEWGDCAVNPPTPFPDEDGTVIGVWPSVEAAHHHCDKYIKVHNGN